MTYDDSDHRAQQARNEAGHPPADLPPAVAERSGGDMAATTPPPRAPEHRTAKGGAPAANNNRIRHGRRCNPELTAIRLNLGTLPDSLKRVEGDVYTFRVLLENAVMEAKGAIALIDAALIQTACRHERASRLALAWLRKHEADLTHTERLAYNKAIADSSAARDKTLERLKIDGSDDSSPWAALDRLRAQQAIVAQPAAASVPAATPERHVNDSGPDAGDNPMPLIPPGF